MNVDYRNITNAIYWPTTNHLFSNHPRSGFISNDGEVHFHKRLNGPADIKPNGQIIFRRYNLIHRENGPAVIDKDNNRYFYLYDNMIDSMNYFLKFGIS